MRLTKSLLIVNGAVFALLSVLPIAQQKTLLSTFAFSTQSMVSGHYWTLITSLFLHGSATHLGLNMVALFFFGGALESEISEWEFLLVYLLGGITGNIASTFVFPPDQLSIGASGAIFALMGGAMLIKPFEFVAFPWIVPVPLLFVGVVMVVSNVLLFIAPPDASNISFIAHIGGFAVGLGYGLHKRGIVHGAVLLAIGFVLLLLLSNVLAGLSAFNYTQVFGSGR